MLLHSLSRPKHWKWHNCVKLFFFLLNHISLFIIFSFGRHSFIFNQKQTSLLNKVTFQLFFPQAAFSKSQVGFQVLDRFHLVGTSAKNGLDSKRLLVPGLRNRKTFFMTYFEAQLLDWFWEFLSIHKENAANLPLNVQPTIYTDGAEPKYSLFT